MNKHDRPVLSPGDDHDVRLYYPDICNYTPSVFDERVQTGSQPLSNPCLCLFLLYQQTQLSVASITQTQFTPPCIDSTRLTIRGTYEGFPGILACVVMQFGNALFVIFKGTTMVSEALVDTQLRLVAHGGAGRSGVSVHEGFLNYYRLLKTRNNLVATVEEMVAAHGIQNVYVSGISLGASVAMLFTLDLRKSVSSVFCVCFAPPRTGNTAFYSLFCDCEADMFRAYINTRDVIPKMPPIGYGRFSDPNDPRLVVFKARRPVPKNVGALLYNHIHAYFEYFDLEIGVQSIKSPIPL